MAERTKYQANIIKNYYQNQDALMLQKLGEQVTELYLAEGKGRAKVWQRIVGHLEKLKVPASRIAHLQKTDDPTLVAKLLEELLAKQ
jgi:phosphoribosyl-ATP pyrophosphohydrolase